MTYGEREKLMARLRQDEGLRLKPYRDTVGKLSIGYGRNLDDVGVRHAEAEMLLANDVQQSEREAQEIKGYAVASGPRQAVVVNMVFNMGLPTLMTFRRMLAAFEKGNYTEAAKQMLDSKWARQVGDRAKRLAQQMRTGEWA